MSTATVETSGAVFADPDLADAHAALRDTVRRFAETEVRPRAAQIDADDEFPHDLYARMADLGLLGLTVAEEHGGQGADAVSMAITLEELARVSGTVANALLLTELQSGLLARIGSDDQRQRWLPELVAGRSICLIAVTEPGTGSDVAAIRTRAVRDGDDWVLDGAKAYMTAGAVGDVAVVLARSDPDAGTRGLSMFLVERSRDGDTRTGFVVDHKEQLLGMRGLATAGLSFTGTRVPAANLLGEAGAGMRNALRSFTNGRIVIASLALGLAVGARDAALDYVRQREAFGHPIGDFQGVQFMLADAHTRIEAARLLIHRAAALKDAGQPYVAEASQAKLFASDTAMQVATDSVQLHGGYGYTKDCVAERIFRDAKLTQIYEGTNQIQRVIIARELMRSTTAPR